MAAYRRVYDSRHLQADCQAPGSTPEFYLSMVLYTKVAARCDKPAAKVVSREHFAENRIIPDGR